MIKNNRIRLLAVINDLMLVGTLLVNALANTIPIAGRTTGEVSDSYLNLFTPIGFTFAIWAIIYFLLILFAGFQTYLAFKKVHPDKDSIQRIGPWFAISSLANIIWIFLWHNGMIYLSMLFMILILISLLKVYTASGIGELVIHPLVKYLIHVPFSIYTGWITVATIANASALLTDTGWTGSPLQPQSWASIMLIIATLITIIFLNKKHDIWFSLVVDWAIFGILMKHLSGYQFEYPLVVITAIIGMLLISVYCIYLIVIGKVYR